MMTVDELKKIKEDERKAFDIVASAEGEAERIIAGIDDGINSLRESMLKKVEEKNRRELEAAAAAGKAEAVRIRNSSQRNLEKVITEAKKNIPRGVELTVKKILE